MVVSYTLRGAELVLEKCGTAETLDSLSEYSNTRKGRMKESVSMMADLSGL
jgi:hypothetical protein